MEQNKKHITPDNITEWLCSTGFLFPRNELELSRFEKLYGDIRETLSGNEVDPDRIINGITDSKVIKMNNTATETNFSEFKMVARNGNSIPKHILEKMKKNQQNPKNNDKGSPEETTK